MKKAKEAVISQAPLIHCITNPISINDCANVVGAGGKADYGRTPEGSP